MSDKPNTTAVEWPYERALSEAAGVAKAEHSAAWVFRLRDGSFGFADCHPSWGWLRAGERLVSRVYSDGSVVAL